MRRGWSGYVAEKDIPEILIEFRRISWQSNQATVCLLSKKTMKRTKQPEEEVGPKNPSESENGDERPSSKVPKIQKCSSDKGGVTNGSLLVNGVAANHDHTENELKNAENSTEKSEFSKFLLNPVALRLFLSYVTLPDWISLEMLNKEWRTAMLVQWQSVRHINGKETAIAIRMLNGDELRWRHINYLKTSRDRKVRLTMLKDWVMARCSSLTSFHDLFTACMKEPGDYVHANILDDFLRFRDLKVVDFGNCTPHLTAVARILEEIGESLEDINLGNGMLAFATATRNVTGAKYSVREKPSDISLAETNGTLQRCFKSLENLKRLSISHCELANGLFLRSLPHPDKLVFLDISYSPKLKYKEIVNSGFFLRCTNLKELVVRMGKADDKMEKVKLILPSIKGLTTLESLTLAGWESTKGMASYDVSEAVAKLTNLKSLSLENTKGIVKEDALREICDSLSQLETLEISISTLSDSQSYESLTKLSKLKILKLSMGVPKLIPKDALKIIADLPSLMELDLGVPAHGTELEGLYGGCEKLETIKISGMAASDELLMEWATKLPKSVLNLHIKAATPEESYRRQKATPPGDAGLIAILSNRGDLFRSLHLSRTAVTDVGLRKIGTAAKNLTEFGLYTTKSYKFSETGVQALIDGCVNLTDLYFDSFVRETFGEVKVPRLMRVKDFEEW